MHARNTRTRRRLVVAALAAGALLAPASALNAAASAAPASAAARATTVTPDHWCLTALDHTTDGQVVTHYYQSEGARENGRWSKRVLPALSFGGVVETPRSMTTVGWDDAQQTQRAMLAVRDNGSLWKVVVTVAGSIETTQIYASGWGGIRYIVGDLPWTEQPRIYALSTSGALYRYSLNKDNAPRHDLTIATSGWESTKFLTPALSGSLRVDSLLGVTTAGALMRNEVNRDTGAVTRVTLKSGGGWDQVKYMTTTTCQGTSGALMMGAFENGDVRAYFEADPTDRNGDDIVSYGRVGRGFLGLVSN